MTPIKKTHVSAYSEAIIRFTNVSYRRPITMRGLWQMPQSTHWWWPLGRPKHVVLWTP